MKTLEITDTEITRARAAYTQFLRHCVLRSAEM